MQDTFKRILISVAIFLAATGAIYLLHFQQESYSFFDFLQGKRPPQQQSEQYTTATGPAVDRAEVPGLASLNDEIAKLTRAVMPSVVSIETSTPDPNANIFHRPRNTRPDQGSGFIVTREGHVITNYHVVKEKQNIRIHVSTNDEQHKMYPAIIVGATEKLDIAVLKIQSERDDFPALKLGNSDAVHVGEVVFAIGNPYGLQKSVTQGNVSALDRRISDGGPAYMQTSAPINPGSSGGPLINIVGEVIGINSIVVRGTAEQPAQGIGFAIPANDANMALTSIMDKGAPVLGYAGLAFNDIPSEIREQNPKVNGVYITQVFANSPAEDARLLPLDVITRYQGQPVTSRRQLARLIHGTEPGTEVTIEIIRRNQQHSVNLTVANLADRNVVAELPSDQSAAEPSGNHNAERTFLKRFGVTVGPVFKANIAGVKVEKLREGSKTALSIEVDDFITGVNDTTVSSPAEFYRAVLNARNDGRIELRIIRRGRLVRAIFEPPY
ncbi:trypsin-like peptidase domain-containing protein [Sulfuriroseicoccus oceanibius]|uniref:Trypsin-like peptidase domain-containing protein n=1 Tax=Sulfuriroseicoccus oceanibius TaxID=2707525 RepID=A0A6B3LDP5_9BACT|nr:trypsin-like peptidase domain-containing protein [Sulfuriroseicoccus oceanibius]QQL45195.1 trypsin-like peptidase domain-containing protein [Sulfuriroseicoccus oceanibius]